MQQLKGSQGAQLRREATMDLLDAAGIRKASRSLREYELAKRVLLGLSDAGALPVSYGQAVRIAADWVGI